MTTLITGSSGFVGSRLCSELLTRKHEIRGIVRSKSSVQHYSHVLGEINSTTDWSNALLGVNCVVHCAARVHVMHETKDNALAAYRAVNVEGTRNLAEQAVACGVKRFIFLSSIKVNGEQTVSKEHFTPEDYAFPEDAYAISKWEAEQVLHEISAKTGLEVVIIRPPLIYGPGVKGNFLSMLDWLNRGIPLPLGAIHNQRSLVGIDNLVDLIITCINHTAAANQIFLVSDDADLSTSELLQQMGKALTKPIRLIPVPLSLLKFSSRLLGKKDAAQRLLGNLQVDISKTKKTLDWAPPISVSETLHRTAEWYLNKQ